MKIKVTLIIILLSLTIGEFGCQQAETTYLTENQLYTEQNTIDIYLLADRLGLEVTEINNTHIKLRNFSNTVMIFTHTGGQFFVNGQACGLVGTIYKQNGHYLVSESLVSEIKAKIQTTAAAPKYFGNVRGKVVIDAGHGGNDPGATACNGVYEKTINLQVAKKIEAILESRGADVIMTRSSDRFIELNERAEIANRNGANLFVSIHADACDDSSVRGFTIYMAKTASYGSKTTAQAMVRAISNAGFAGKGIREDNFRVLVRTRCPAVLVEMGYLSNYQDASLLINNNFQNRMAEAIANGICQSIGSF